MRAIRTRLGMAQAKGHDARLSATMDEIARRYGPSPKPFS
jgi:hypothetical protein